MSEIRAYPLAWPPGWPRTTARQAGQYRTELSGALKNLRRELQALAGASAAKTLVLSSNYSLGAGDPKDSGVVAYFTWDQTPFAIPCDRWVKIAHNVQAIALTIEAMRAMERHGARHMIKVMFRGFEALPSAGPGQRHWTDVLELHGEGVSRDLIDHRYRYLANMAHPDKGGSHEAMAILNVARDQAMQDITA